MAYILIKPVITTAMQQSSKPPKNFRPEPFAYGEIIELEISSLANSGAGVGRIDNWVVFVPFALPGELVKAKVWMNDKNHSNADLLEVLRPSSERVEPRCELFGQCGGCQYQHLDYQAQLKYKTAQVAELLKLQAGIEHPVNPAIASPQIYNYRSKITPHFHKPQQGRIDKIGFLRHSARQTLIDVPHCPIAMESINAALPALRHDTHQAARSYKRGATLLLRAGVDGICTNPRATIEERVGDISFHFLAGDFFQNNPYILQQFTDYVAAQACKLGAKYLIDAYCGSGLFALCLAKHFDQVAGVEVNASAADWARGNAADNNIENVSFLAASSEAIFAEIAFPGELSCVLIDPPRKGCDEVFLQQLFKFAPARVVYVSCNPATQIRDLEYFKQAGYVIDDVQPFDLFPHTKHLECVVSLRKQG